MSKEIESGIAARETSNGKLPPPTRGIRRWGRRGLGLAEIATRVAALGGAVAALITMATTDEQLPVFTQFFQFEARYNDIPAFTFFVIANAIAAAYHVLVGIPLSVVHMVRADVVLTRAVVLMPLDCMVLAVQTAGASAAAAMDYLDNKGNSRANWFSICQQFGDFCRNVTAAIVISFISVLFFLLLVSLSSFALFRIAKRATRTK